MLTFAIGDIHGCLAKLRRLVAACESHASGAATRYVCLGDYIDRGPQSRGVIEYLIAWQKTADVICLKGNHEQIAIDAHRSPDAVAMWLRNGGVETGQSYASTGGLISEDHIAWMDALPYSYDDGLRFFVHAGVDLSVPLDRQAPDKMIWIREPFLSRSDAVDMGRLIVHGHTPQTGGEPDVRKHRVNVDTGAVMGGPLTAAVFDDTQAEPLTFLRDRQPVASASGLKD